MEQKFFDAVYEELRPLLAERGFSEKDGVFSSESRSFRVDYDESRKLFVLSTAEAGEGGLGEYKSVSEYLFDESSATVGDATAVGIDFNDTAATILGVTRRATRSSSVALPQKTAGDTPGIDDLTAKLLAVFPRHKDAYRAHVEKYGELLYVHFFRDTFCEDLRDLMQNGTEKKQKKLYDALNELYVKGDRQVGNAIIVVLFGGAIGEDGELAARVVESLGDFPYLKTAVRSLADRAKRDRRLKDIYTGE